MRLWKRRAMELADTMRELDPDGAGLTFVELHRASGDSRALLRAALAWLQEVGLVEMSVHTDKRHRWKVLPDDVDPSEPPPFVAPPEDLINSNAAEELLSSLQ